MGYLDELSKLMPPLVPGVLLFISAPLYAAGWSAAVAFSPTGNPDPTRGAQTSALAVGEKISALATKTYLNERAARAFCTGVFQPLLYDKLVEQTRIEHDVAKGCYLLSCTQCAQVCFGGDVAGQLQQHHGNTVLTSNPAIMKVIVLFPCHVVIG